MPIPQPFRRPRVVVSGPADGVRRAWRHVRADQVSPGDVVAGVGRVERVDTSMFALEGYVEFVRTDVSAAGFPEDAVVYAFTRAEEES